MKGGECDLLGLSRPREGVGRFETAEEGELREEIGGGFELAGESLESLQILAAGIVVREFALHVIVVDREEDAFDHGRGTERGALWHEVGEGENKLRPFFSRLGGDFGFGEPGEVGGAGKECLGPLPKGFSRLVADPGEKSHDALEGHFIARVDGEFEKRGDILDVGLLEKPESTGDRKGNAALGEFQLHFHRVVVCAVEHGHLLERDALVEEFHHTLGDEGGLLGIGREGDKGWFDGVWLADGGKGFWKLAFVSADGGVGDFEDLGDASIVRFDFKNAGARVVFGKLEDVFEIRAPPGVDALGVVSHDHEILVVGGEEVDEFGLEAVRILVFIHEDLLEAALVKGGDFGVGQKKLKGFGKKVIEIHRVRLALSGFVGGLDFLDLRSEGDEVAVFFGEDFANGGGGVDGEAEDVGEDSGFGEFAGGIYETLFRDHGGDHFLRVVAVHDGKSLAEPDVGGVAAEDAVSDRVEGAAPESIGRTGQEVVDALHHFAGGFVGESEQEDGTGGDALFQKPGDSIGERSGFSTACASDHQGSAG